MANSKFIIRVLSLLGFATAMNACGWGTDMYGSPTADFAISGRVTSESGAALNGIRVVVGPEQYDAELSYYYDRQCDTVYTDRFGVYHIFIAECGSLGVYNLRADDIDGPKNNGEYQSDSTKIEVRRGDFKGGKDWYGGKATKTADFKLTHKK